MKIKLLSFLLVSALGFGAFAADRLAIAEPVGKGGVKAEEIEAVWGMLEASVDGGYELVSRTALQQMLTEIGLTTSSDLVDLNSPQKAKLGQLKTVKYLLITSVGKLGSRLNISMTILDSSTGEIDPEKKAAETVKSLDELADKLPDMLNEMGIGKEVKTRGRSAILAPVIKVADAPGYLGDDFNVRLEEALLESGIKLQNLQSVAKILKKNDIDNLYEVEPAMFTRIGGLLRVDFLIQATVNRFSCTVKKEYIQATRRTVTRVIGDIDGNIRIISAQTGEVAASVPFREKVDFDDLEDTEDWTNEDYGKHLIESVVPKIYKNVVLKLK